MGVWNSHTSVGNILGSLIAGVFVSSEWGMSFIVPGLIIASMGILCFFFLVESQFTVCCIYVVCLVVDKVKSSSCLIVSSLFLRTWRCKLHSSSASCELWKTHFVSWSTRNMSARAHTLVFVCQSVQESSEEEPLLQNSSHVDRTINGVISTEPAEIVEENTEAISFCGALSIPVSVTVLLMCDDEWLV